MSRGHTEAWQAARDARAARRRRDPEVLARRAEHARREATRLREQLEDGAAP